MKHLFKPEMINRVIVVFGVLLIAKLIWMSVSMIWLPTAGVPFSEEKRYKGLSYRVDLTPQGTPKAAVPAPRIVHDSIKDITLLAIYSAADKAVITVKYKSKSKVISRGEEINGFVFISAGSDHALFKKNGKHYKLFLHKSKVSQESTAVIKRANLPKARSVTSPQGKVVDTGDRKIVDRSLLSHYSDNLDEISKHIGIVDIKNGKELQGFKVSFVRRGSHFDKLGLKKGDIIKSVNGEAMDSYSVAMEIYTTMKDINFVTLVIERNKKEMELEYEVN